MPLVIYASLDLRLAFGIFPQLAGLDEPIVLLLRACAAFDVPIENYSLAKLADGLLEGSPIYRIIISDTDLDDIAAHILAEFSENHPFFHMISIGGGSIGTPGALEFASMFRHSKVTDFCLYDNPIGEEGGLAILEALQNNPWMQFCDCDGPGISDETRGAISSLAKIRNDQIIPFLAEKAACYIIIVSRLSNREEMGDLAVLPKS